MDRKISTTRIVWGIAFGLIITFIALIVFLYKVNTLEFRWFTNGKICQKETYGIKMNGKQIIGIETPSKETCL